MTLSPRQAGRLGGLAYAAKNNMTETTQAARDTYAGSWYFGHGCTLCGDRIEIPFNTATPERQRRADALKKRHYTLMAMKRHNQ